MAIAIGVIGAVANPMFSLALYLARQITPREAVSDWIGQFLGGIFGAALIFGINDADRVPVGAPTAGTTSGFAELGAAVLAAELVLSRGRAWSCCCRRSASGCRPASVAAFAGAAYALATLFLLPDRRRRHQPGPQPGDRRSSPTPTPTPSARSGCSSSSRWSAPFGGLVVWLLIDEATIDDTMLDDTLRRDRDRHRHRRPLSRRRSATRTSPGDSARARSHDRFEIGVWMDSEVHVAAAAGMAAASFSGLSAMTASVVRNRAAIEAAFCSAERVTLAASMTPILTRSS